MFIFKILKWCLIAFVVYKVYIFVGPSNVNKVFSDASSIVKQAV